MDGTPVPRKVARLHLICDILHNSAISVPSAWKFRQEFQARLGIVFDHMANIYHSFPGRITADVFKKQITSVVDIWDDWIVFPPDFTLMLRKRLEGSSTHDEPGFNMVEAEQERPAKAQPAYASRFKTSAFKSTMAPSETPADMPREELDGEPLDDAPMNDDVDGQPLDEDLDGEPMEDDEDGVPMVEDDDIDGAPMDELDGEPMQE